jgi:phospholipase C
VAEPTHPWWHLTRRGLLKRGGSLGAALTMSGLGNAIMSASAAAATTRVPGSLPDPTRPAGTATAAMPFDHVVCVMMENHSFDNLLGALSRLGQPNADGLTFDRAGQATNSNPSSSGSTEPMGYWTDWVLPFAYSLARTFCSANRWFCSAPCQTYPNRRFLMAGTAYGNITTDTQSLQDPPPPSGTIFDRLHAYGISWANYFTDLPQTGIIPTIIEKYPTNLAPIAKFLVDCAAGTLPSVSFVDPEFGVLSDIGSPLASLPQVATQPVVAEVLQNANGVGGDQESPQDMYYGEAWAYRILHAVLQSPAWSRTLLIYTYDEHGGYYDHVPPPAAIAPDSIPPGLSPGDAPGGYNLYGPRVPGIVVSPYSKPNGVTNVVHDHTSVLATIEAKWNLPAVTYRDANATTVMDFLDVKRAAFLEPPTTLVAPSPAGPSGPVGTSS